MKARLKRHAIVLALLAATFHPSPIAVAQQTAPVIDSSRTVRSAPPTGVIPEAWPANVQINRLSDIGRRKAVIFSPDFAESGNREFYEKLGFLYIEDASWLKALNRIIARNYWHPEDRIETIFLETHGTNGNGLKLQDGPSPTAPCSYISIAALQEKLDGLGVRLCVIAACNSGRLFRPHIYKAVNPQTRDRLFLPATLGIFNATPGYDPSRSKVFVVRRAESRIETTSYGDSSELSAVARVMLRLEEPGGRSPGSRRLRFVVSNLLIQMMIHDRGLKVTTSGYANEKSRKDLSNAESEILFQRFLSHINDVASKERRIAQPGTFRAVSNQRSARRD